MRYAYYPGCVAQGGAPELFHAMKLVGERLGFTLEHLKEAACTGAGVLQERDPELGDTLNARTFAMAEQRGLPLMTICSTCQGVMSQANHRLKADPDYRNFINTYLEPEGLSYNGTTEVKHFMWILVEDYGLDRLKEHVTKPLSVWHWPPSTAATSSVPRSSLATTSTPSAAPTWSSSSARSVGHRSTSAARRSAAASPSSR